MLPALPALILATALAAAPAAAASDGERSVGHGSQAARAFWEALTPEQREALLTRHRSRAPATQVPTVPAEPPPVRRERRYQKDPWRLREDGDRPGG